MKKILTIIWKDTLLRFVNPWEWAFFIGLPLIFTFLVSGGAPSGEADFRLRLVVVDQAGSALSQQIITALEQSNALRPELLSLEQAEEQLEGRQAEVVLIIPAGLDIQAVKDGNAAVELRQQPNSLNASVAARAVQSALRRVSGSISAANQALAEAEARGTFESESDRLAYFEQSLSLAQQVQAQAPERVTVAEGSTPDEVTYDPRANSSAGQLITWVFIPLFGISAMFAYERERGTLRRILITPTSRTLYLFGTIAGQVMLALAQMTLLILFGTLVLKVQWGREPLALFLVMTTAALAAAAIGTAMGTFIKSEGQANGLSIMAGMVMALMGGCWYPLELFPQAVQTAVKVLPTTWAMQGLMDLLLRGGGLLEILPEAGVLLGFAALFLGIGVSRFRYE